jgi:hypothetical protein
MNLHDFLTTIENSIINVNVLIFGGIVIGNLLSFHKKVTDGSFKNNYIRLLFVFKFVIFFDLV